MLRSIGAAAAFMALTAPVPIPQDPLPPEIPAFSGEVATPRPLFSPDPPRHPYMAPNGRSNLHVDAYQTDVHQVPGPLGAGTAVSSTFQIGVCASVTFDAQGRIVTVCVGPTTPRLMLLDPVTLDELAATALPNRRVSANPFQDFTGGGYFYLDHEGRAVVPTTDRRLKTFRVTEEPGFELVSDVDLSAAVPEGDGVVSVLPDYAGRIWFVSKGGVVGFAERDSSVLHALRLDGEAIENSFAVGEDGGVYIVSDRALYRFDVSPGGEPAVTWREAYANSGVAKPGQVGAGSGTTPTLMGSDLVAITDNDDPMNVVVYRRGVGVEGEREVCRVPVFARGQSATDQSLIATRRSIVTENNFGYTGPGATSQGGRTAAGLARIDVRRGLRGCEKVWTSTEVAPSVVPKLSAPNGLVYTYTKEPGRGDPWALTALDFATGETVFKRLAGEGLGFNNNYAPITLGPDGAAYVGVLGGLVRLADAQPPPVASPPPPDLVLRVSRRGGDRVHARAGGPSARDVERVVFLVGERRAATDTTPSFRRRFRTKHPDRVRARVLMLDGRTVTLEPAG